MLDNTLLLYTSYMADGNHGTNDYPVLLAGGAGGRLKGGRQLDYPRGTPAANLYVEMCNLAGVEADEFGNSVDEQERQIRRAAAGTGLSYLKKPFDRRDAESAEKTKD